MFGIGYSLPLRCTEVRGRGGPTAVGSSIVGSIRKSGRKGGPQEEAAVKKKEEKQAETKSKDGKEQKIKSRERERGRWNDQIRPYKNPQSQRGGA